MDNSKSKSIPQWQRRKEAQGDEKEVPQEQPQTSPENRPEQIPDGAASARDGDETSLSRASLIESASQFLQHDSICSASISEKTAFLESKGLTRPEIEQLLQDLPSEESQPAVEQTTTAPNPEEASPPSVSSPTTTPSTTAAAPSASPLQQAPPIITYPEFLSHAHRPPPLITTTRVLNAAYATAFTTGVLWGTNKYLLTPMLESLTAARHSLFEGTISNLEEMNKKLEGTVSVIPAIVDAGEGRGRKAGDENGQEGDTDSEASDPTELFHRDIGVQTSPDMSTGEGNAAGSGEKEGAAASPVEEHTERLQTMRKHLADLAATSEETLTAQEETSSSLGDLQAYLEEMAYGGNRNWQRFDGGFGPLGEPMVGARDSADSKVDEVARFKADIRSVKGALLSARNFPSGGLGRGRVGVAAGT
ncbi:hypothetical protein MMC10_010370 [Thelotrema lepadinum]|nr:hypothetical protein [Thelotrema lepadinum]